MWIGQQVALIALLLAAAGMPFLVFLRRRTPLLATRILAVLLLMSPIACLIAAISYHDREIDFEGLRDHRPVQSRNDDYVQSHSCRACHPNEHASWHSSYHRTMTQVASKETVLGSFDNRFLHADGIDYFLYREGDDFMVKIPQYRFQGKVVLTTGSHHMQLYWYRTMRGRMLGLLPFSYLIEDQKWVPRSTTFLMPYHTGNETATWNMRCVRCHTTHPRPKATDPRNIQTEVAEFGISCEACHGPGEEHVRLNSNPLYRYRNRDNGKRDPSIVNPARLDHHQSAQVCGLCHSVSSTFLTRDDLLNFHENGFRFRPGGDLHQARHVVQLLTAKNDPITRKLAEAEPDLFDSSFWPDGMVRVTGREYNGLVQSPCYQRGQMTCTSCHTMHQRDGDARPAKEWADDQLTVGMRKSSSCLDCHPKYSNTAELTAHTHHGPQSSGSNCLNCHMPHTVYGLQKASRSHQISVPSVMESLQPESNENLASLEVSVNGEKRSVILEARKQSGRPNACNQCHMDKTLAWTAQHLEAWYGQPAPSLGEEQKTYSFIVLQALRGDAGQRALAAWNLGWGVAQEATGRRWIAPYLGELLEDPYDAIRYIAHRSLKTLPGYENFEIDYVAKPTKDRKASRRVIDIWNRQQKESQQPFGAAGLLINPTGELQHDLIQQLLQQRNNRPVILAE